MTDQATFRFAGTAGEPARPREQAYDRFKRRLLAGELQPGDLVSLRELVRQLDLPLAAVREALSRLEGEGLVRVFPKRGIQVCPIDMTFAREAFQLRSILEREGIRALAGRGDLAALEAMEQRFLALREAARTDLTPSCQAEAIAADRALHQAIIAGLENAMIVALYGQVCERLLLVRAATRLPPGGMVLAATEEHLAILSALRRRDEEGAASALARHLEASMRRQMGVA